MIYYNTKTGAVVESDNILKGKNWQAVEPANSAINEEPKPKKSKKKVKQAKTEQAAQDADSIEAANEKTPEEEQ